DCKMPQTRIARCVNVLPWFPSCLALKGCLFRVVLPRYSEVRMLANIWPQTFTWDSLRSKAQVSLALCVVLILSSNNLALVTLYDPTLMNGTDKALQADDDPKCFEGARQLEPGETRPITIEPGKADCYRIKLKAGEFMHIVVTQ